MLQRQPGCACGGGCPRCQESSLQTKLKISEPGDRYEQEADRVADQVMRMSEPTIQREMKPEEDEEEGMVQRKAIANSITPLQPSSTGQDQPSEVSPIVNEVLNSSGQPLDSETQTFMESRFGRDFSQVRIHFGATPAQSARDVNAHAYTVGNNIVFGAGQPYRWAACGRLSLVRPVYDPTKSPSSQCEQKYGLTLNLPKFLKPGDASVSDIGDPSKYRGWQGSAWFTYDSNDPLKVTPDKQPGYKFKGGTIFGAGGHLGELEAGAQYGGDTGKDLTAWFLRGGYGYTAGEKETGLKKIGFTATFIDWKENYVLAPRNEGGATAGGWGLKTTPFVSTSFNVGDKKTIDDCQNNGSHGCFVHRRVCVLSAMRSPFL